MPAGVTAQLDALKALLASAQELAGRLSGDSSLRRIAAALAGLCPEERQILATAIERGIAWRRVNEAVSGMSGVRLRINPNPPLFLRVIDAETGGPSLPDPDEVLPGTLRLLRRAPILAMPEAEAVWKPAVLEALGLLSPEERAACVTMVRTAAALLESATTTETDTE
jgi:hypothetical protein